LECFFLLQWWSCIYAFVFADVWYLFYIFSFNIGDGCCSFINQS
jgi:hypothetical protein